MFLQGTSRGVTSWMGRGIRSSVVVFTCLERTETTLGWTDSPVGEYASTHSND